MRNGLCISYFAFNIKRNKVIFALKMAVKWAKLNFAVLATGYNFTVYKK
jgi:hypothetical protein